MIEFTIRGLGLWTPGFADPVSWSRRHVLGDRSEVGDASVTAPRAELLPPMMRRRTSLLTRMAAEVAAQAIASGGLERAEATLIYGSVYGEIRTTLDLLAALQEPAAPLSPTKFHNSVHNTAGGYVSIVTENRRGNAAMTAGRSTLAMGLIECAGLIAAGQGPAVLVIAEETLPEPLAAGRSWAPLAAAFAISGVGGVGAGVGEVGAGPSDMPFRTCRLVQGRGGSAPALPVRLPASVAANPCALALALVELALRPGPSLLALEPHLDAGWCLEVAGPEAAG